MTAQVTAMGIRDGDPAVLQALVNRRGSAVLAYCEKACAPSLALDAAAEAFARFRATVLAAERPTDIDPEAALLTATRRAAAARSPRPPERGGATGLSRLLGGRASTDRLPEVPDLLVARTQGTIGDEDAAVLDSLLDASPVARAFEERFAAAEEAYRSAPRRPMPAPVTAQIVATMSALAATPPAAAETAGNGSAPPAGPRFFRAPDEPPPVPLSFAPEDLDGETVEWTAPTFADDDGAPETNGHGPAHADEPEASDAIEPGEALDAADFASADDPAETDGSGTLGASDADELDVAAGGSDAIEAAEVADETDIAATDDEELAIASEVVAETPGVEEPPVEDDPVEEPPREDPGIDEPPADDPGIDEPPAPEETPALDEPVAGGAIAASALEDQPPVDLDHDVEGTRSELAEPDATVEWDAPQTVDEAVPDGAEIAAARASEDVDPDGTVEWSVPEDELGAGPELEHEIAAARMQDGRLKEDPAHLQSASGAVPEEDVAAAPPSPPPPVDPDPPAHVDPPAEHHPHRSAAAARAALLPAGAVVTIAAIGAIAASGILGGNEESPPLDTGIVPERALQAVPEGETATIVDDLRSAASDARRRRLADQRQELAEQQLATPPAAEEDEETSTTPTTPTEEASAAEEPAAPPAPTDEGAGATGEAPAGEGGTSAEDATGGGTESP